MKAVHTIESTPSEKGSFSFAAGGLAIASPCCGTVIVTGMESVSVRNPLSAGPFDCGICGKPFVVVAGEFSGPAEPQKVERATAQPKVEARCQEDGA